MGQGTLRECRGDAVCPDGAKALLCGAPDFGGFTGESALRGGLPFRKGWQARREDGGWGSAVGKGWIYTSYAGHAVLWVKTRPFPTERSVSPTRSEDRLSAPPATAIFPRHPAGRTAGSARTRPRDQDRLSSKCNSLEEDIERRAPVETLAGPVVDQIKDALKLRL